MATSRRDFLRVGTLSLGGLMLPQFLAMRAAAGESYLKDRAVVLLYLSGGASHIETFDPKMTAPEGVRSITGEVATTLPGVSFGGTFPLLAQQAKRLAVVRSFSHNVGDHNNAHVHVLSGGTDPLGMQTQGFSIGSMSAKLRAGQSSSSGLPSYITLTEQEVDSQYNRERERFANGSWAGKLGTSYAPFPHEIGWQGKSEGGQERKKAKSSKNENPLLEDMRLNLTEHVLHNRVELLRQLDGLQRTLDASGTMQAVDGFSSQALELVLGGAKASVRSFAGRSGYHSTV